MRIGLPFLRGLELRGVARWIAAATGAFLLTFLLGGRVAFAEDAASLPAQTQAAVDVLQQWYVLESGLYRTTGWWNSANAITALANYSRVAHSTKYLSVFANTLRAAQTGHDGAPGFINRYYDDEGWWALAWIDVYDLTGEEQYLDEAASIFSDMQQGWDTEVCGGGVWWSKDKKDKNAIENELFLAVAASLANREKDAAKRAGYLGWARKEWVWFRDSGMINGDHLINDGLKLSDPAHCINNGKNPWTYNQGVILGALVELNHADRHAEFKKTAKAVALAAISHLTDAQGVLHELNNAHSGGDVPQFKGIFVRNLMLLNGAFPDRRYAAFFATNARSIESSDKDAAGQLGFWWAGPFDAADASRQSSALDALIAAEHPERHGKAAAWSAR
jgi:predicted alpha-1,6-mannanase (GH76 family)